MTESSYDPFAALYERLWSQGSLTPLKNIFGRMVAPRLPVAARVADVACGTGAVAAWLAGDGHRVTGVDLSDAMLQFARSRCAQVEWLRQDVRMLKLEKPQDAILCCYDSLNHLLDSDDLGAAFAAIHNQLVPGGSFLFDLNMREGFLARWRGSFQVIEDDVVCVVRARFDEVAGRGTFYITGFLGGPPDWQRVDLVLEEALHPPEVVLDLLDRMGFCEIQQWPAGEFGWNEVGRQVFLARRGR